MPDARAALPLVVRQRGERGARQRVGALGLQILRGYGAQHRRVDRGAQLRGGVEIGLEIFARQRPARPQAQPQERRAQQKRDRRRPGFLQRRQGGRDQAGVGGVDVGGFHRFARAHQKRGIDRARGFRLALQLAQVDVGLAVVERLRLHAVQLEGKRLFVGIGARVIGLDRLTQALGFLGDEAAHFVERLLQGGDVGMAGAEQPAGAGELFDQRAFAVAQLGHDDGGHRFGRALRARVAAQLIELGFKRGDAVLRARKLRRRLVDLLIRHQLAGRNHEPVGGAIILDRRLLARDVGLHLAQPAFQLPGGVAAGGGAGFALVLAIGGGDGVGEFGGARGRARRHLQVEHERLVGAVVVRLLAQGLQRARPCRLLGGASVGRLEQRGDALRQRVEQAAAVEFGIGVQMGRGDRALEHGVGQQHAALALHLRDAAVGGDGTGVDVVGDDLLVAGVDEDLRGRGILRSGQQAIGERGQKGARARQRDAPAPPPEDAAHGGDLDRIDLAARRAQRRRVGHLRRHRHLSPHGTRLNALARASSMGGAH